MIGGEVPFPPSAVQDILQKRRLTMQNEKVRSFVKGEEQL
jgi:hypothetical protein